MEHPAQIIFLLQLASEYSRVEYSDKAFIVSIVIYNTLATTLTINIVIIMVMASSSSGGDIISTPWCNGASGTVANEGVFFESGNQQQAVTVEMALVALATLWHSGAASGDSGWTKQQEMKCRKKWWERIQQWWWHQHWQHHGAEQWQWPQTISKE